jgi:hypothetical protein
MTGMIFYKVKTFSSLRRFFPIPSFLTMRSVLLSRGFFYSEQLQRDSE